MGLTVAGCLGTPWKTDVVFQDECPRLTLSHHRVCSLPCCHSWIWAVTVVVCAVHSSCAFTAPLLGQWPPRSGDTNTGTYQGISAINTPKGRRAKPSVASACVGSLLHTWGTDGEPKCGMAWNNISKTTQTSVSFLQKIHKSLMKERRENPLW